MLLWQATGDIRQGLRASEGQGGHFIAAQYVQVGFNQMRVVSRKSQCYNRRDSLKFILAILIGLLSATGNVVVATLL